VRSYKNQHIPQNNWDLTPILQMWVCGFCKMPVKREQVRIRAPLEDCAAMLSAMDE
jgi:hypothetical protein